MLKLSFKFWNIFLETVYISKSNSKKNYFISIVNVSKAFDNIALQTHLTFSDHARKNIKYNDLIISPNLTYYVSDMNWVTWNRGGRFGWRPSRAISNMHHDLSFYSARDAR